MSSSKEKVTFAAFACMSEAQNPPPPPPYTHCILVYSILMNTGKGGGGEDGES
jgi:hypothetical protein